MQPTFDFCVLGNGLLGAAAALYLAEHGASVCLIGSDINSRVSSHNDHSRIYRSCGSDPYWSALAKENLCLMTNLQNSTGINFFRHVPVYYDEALQGAKACPTGIGFLSHDNLNYCDPSGGVIDPLIYISAMNYRARNLGVQMQVAVAASTTSHGFYHSVVTDNGSVIKCTKIADFRGLYSTGGTCGSVIARTSIHITHRPISEPHCFIRTKLETPGVAEFFGCSHLGFDGSHQTSKFVVADSESILLSDIDLLHSWYDSGYRYHPRLQWALDEITGMGYTIGKVKLSPCAFSRTLDGRPQITNLDGHLRFFGCNGGVAKCAQSLSKLVLDNNLL